MATEELGQERNMPCTQSLTAEFIEIKGMGKGRENRREREREREIYIERQKAASPEKNGRKKGMGRKGE